MVRASTVQVEPDDPSSGKGNLPREGDIWDGPWRMSRSFQVEYEEGIPGSKINVEEEYKTRGMFGEWQEV